MVDYDSRLMARFARLLKNNGITCRQYRKMRMLIIRDGFVTIYKIVEPGIWSGKRIDNNRTLSNCTITIHVNSIQDVLVKSLRYQLIPYEKMRNIVKNF